MWMWIFQTCQRLGIWPCCVCWLTVTEPFGSKMFNKPERKENWKVLLLDREYFSELKQNQFIMDGDPLETWNNSQGFGKYKIKIYEDNNIEDDPKFRCKGRIRLIKMLSMFCRITGLQSVTKKIGFVFWAHFQWFKWPPIRKWKKTLHFIFPRPLYRFIPCYWVRFKDI